jgi:uncharacterized protein (UPF0276 family)
MSSVFGFGKLHGVGLGLRRVFLQQFRNSPPTHTNFFELAPENWIHVHGKSRDLLDEIADQFPMVCHGLSLNLGGQAPLDLQLLNEVRDFLNRYNVLCYSEHLSYSSDDGHLYDLLPIPFTAQAVSHVSDRIKCVQDFLGQRLAVENVSYYCAPGQEMPEIDFLQQVLEAADCSLLLDVNNIYVNSVNQNYSAQDFLTQIPTQRIAYGHIAGHRKEQEDLLIDTHGADVVDPVWDLLDLAYVAHGVFPTLLERDFNIPALQSLELELQQIQDIQIRHQTKSRKISIGV